MIDAPAACATRTPFEIVSDTKPTSVAEKRLLRPISRHLEDQAYAGGLPTVILACFQHAEYFTPRIAERYGQLADATAFTAALGVELETDPHPACAARCSRATTGSRTSGTCWWSGPTTPAPSWRAISATRDPTRSAASSTPSRTTGR